MKWASIGFAIAMTVNPALAEKVSIKWNGDYPHNNEKTWPDIVAAGGPRYGWSRNFMNGTPEENRVIQREGFLTLEMDKPKGTNPFPFAILLHSCTGMDEANIRWAKDLKTKLLDAGIGVAILDSFGARGVKHVCGHPGPHGHWARRRSEDVYSAFDYLVESKAALPKEVYLVGRDNGALTALMAVTLAMHRDHINKFAGIFAISPHCLDVNDKTFFVPIKVFITEADQDNSSKDCTDLLNKSRAQPLKVTVFSKDVSATFEVPDDSKSHSRFGALDDFKAARDTNAEIISSIKAKSFESGVVRKAN